MELVAVTTEQERRAAARAGASCMRKGGVVLYPTDTLYGLGADAFSDEAVGRIYEIKGRDEGKPVHAIVANIEMAEQYGELDDLARLLLRELPKGMLTLIVPKKRGLDTGICRGIKTFGFRIPQHALCVMLLDEFGYPITATSANASGKAPPRAVADILAQLGAKAPLVSLAIDEGELPARAASTVVDLSGHEPVILREGAIPASDVWETLELAY